MGITHPAWGGPEFPPSELLKDFDEALDIILFGHTHEPLIQNISGTLFVNPGQGYKSFMVDGTMAVITIDNGVADAEIIVIESGRS
ncbi:MAG: metallophosphoesterase family protein [SAR202 cluster bacterium]|nr:metallophosphoesterase family protein [SAR202 cluster bacterium]